MTPKIQSVPALQTRQPSVTADRRVRTVLILDGDPAHRTMLTRTLRASGFRTLAAATAAKAARLWTDKRPDFILADWLPHDSAAFQICRVSDLPRFPGHPA